ncbi:uncharacterized protein LOC125646882 [Ostrea edulis]|uniref:uncharacterized protein LOC125646882 n=1 Tax=Ostrea edulis TaxID=37623 RepID=UPI0024AEF458|nr:uncharacterized protein LOC125646882 [Ostrea edulis]
MANLSVLFVLVHLSIIRIQVADLAVCSGIFRPLTGLYEYCYWMTATMQNSTESSELCGQDGGTLAWVNSQEAQEFVKSIFTGKLAPGSQFYIGVQDRDVSGDYYTYTKEKQHYFNWDTIVYHPPGQPAWQCVMVVYDTFKWREVRCLFPKLALCSKAIQREYLSSYLNRVHYGKALSGYEVFVLEDVSFIRCAFACQMNVRCRSINHDVTSRRCTVNSETATSYPAQLTAAPGVSYYTVFI